MRSLPLLRVKLLPPPTDGLISCEKSDQFSQDILNHRLTTITAGPGYGKSALIGQALSLLEVNSLYLRLDETDCDLSVFLNYLCVGIREKDPAFDFRLPDNLPDLLSDPASRNALLYKLLLSLEVVSAAGLVIVLDDFHTVQQNAEIKTTLTLLLRDAAPRLRFVLISRTPILLPFARMRAGRQLKELVRADLTFSPAEILELFARQFALSLEDQQVEGLSQTYQGWIAGLILLAQTLQGQNSGELKNSLAPTSPLPQPIYEYFSEQVYQSLSVRLKDFLQKTALLNTLEVDFCLKLTARNDSKTILQSLCNQNLFVERQTGADTYSYHPLFQRFLRQQLVEEFSPAGVCQEHRKVALLYEDRAEIGDALQQYLAAGDESSLCRLLDQEGEQLFQDGQFQLLEDCMAPLSSWHLADYPRIEFLQGKLRGFFGAPAVAAQAYRRALRIFEKLNDRHGIQLCLLEIAISYYHVGEMDQAANFLDRLLALPDIVEDLQIEAAGYLIFIAANLKDQPQWQDLYPKAVATLDKIDTKPLTFSQKAWLDVYRGYVLNSLGEREQALELGRSVAWRLQELAGEKEVHGCYALIAHLCFYTQRFEEGLEWAEKGISLLSEATDDCGRQLARSSPSGSRERGTQDMALPLLLHHAANNAFALGKIAESIAYARQSVASFRAMGVRWGEAWALNVLSIAYTQQGDLALAEQSLLAGLECSQGLSRPRMEGTLKGNLSVVLIARGRHEEALPLLKAAERTLTPKHLARWVDLWYANYYWQLNREKGRRRLRRALTLFDTSQDYGILAEQHWIVPLLVDSFARGQFRNYILAVLRRIGVDARQQLKKLLTAQATPKLKSAVASLLRELPKPAPFGLKISLLGSFRLSIGEREVTSKGWRNHKARTLLQYLAHELPNGYISREILTELLWPEADPLKTRNRFHVAMTTLRKILEPDLPEGVPSSYISRSGETYRLQLGDSGCVDVHNFKERLARARKEVDPTQSCKLYNEALSNYSGDLLAEDPYCDWASESRYQLRREYLNCLEKLMQHYEKQGDISRCIGYAENYLAIEPTAEPVFRDLMAYHARNGNLLMVATCLNRCRENMQNELDCQPDEKTVHLARQLLAEAAEPSN